MRYAGKVSQLREEESLWPGDTSRVKPPHQAVQADMVQRRSFAIEEPPRIASGRHLGRRACIRGFLETDQWTNVTVWLYDYLIAIR